MKRLTGIFCLLLATAPAAALPGDILLSQVDGSELRLDEPARRLVTLSPNLAELVFAAGAGDALLATVEYSEYPEEAAQLPRVGDAFRLDIEGIVARRPDLVIAWDSGNPEAAVSQLSGLGIPVWSVEIREPSQIASVLEDIGRATGATGQADEAARRVRNRLAGLQSSYGGSPTLRYFYQVDAKPLFTINGDHLISQGLQLCGGENIFGEEPGLAFQVTRESVIAADPDAIFAPALNNGEDPLSGWQEWPGMRAVASGALYRLPADEISRATPRWLDALELACTLLHNLR